jgi:hypothetical protein
MSVRYCDNAVLDGQSIIAPSPSTVKSSVGHIPQQELDQFEEVPNIKN